MDADQPTRVVATDAAIAEIERLKETYGPLAFFQSGGCCDGSSPMCFREGHLLLGEIAGCPFSIDTEQYERWCRPSFVIDVAPGAGSGMSLEGVHDLHFVVRGP